MLGYERPSRVVSVRSAVSFLFLSTHVTDSIGLPPRASKWIDQAQANGMSCYERAGRARKVEVGQSSTYICTYFCCFQRKTARTLARTNAELSSTGQATRRGKELGSVDLVLSRVCSKVRVAQFVRVRASDGHILAASTACHAYMWPFVFAWATPTAQKGPSVAV